MTLQSIREILRQAKELKTVKSIYFEGGEPFLYYPILAKGIAEAANKGFKVGIVTNGYWATTLEDALEWLRPFKGSVQDLSISSDLFHWEEKISRQARNGRAAAEKLGIPVGTITIVEQEGIRPAFGQLPPGESLVMYRGRAAEKLVEKASKRPWAEFNKCPHEDLRELGRVHVDFLGHAHICQGISLGNLFQTGLTKICEDYKPEAHPITGPLLAGGPSELVRRYGLEHEDNYVDACHLCYTARLALRSRFPEILTPDQMYGVM